ncbi:DMT family transporter [Desulfosediminicola ganghwensis]|uniref:DMT family transporter n=1 Tax=Desulfosediminicola ganghwensis TaxID=2569540 RepID=UPI0010AB5707|nr:multidrug efflux SMR transporter [Desulfosediminicola ganghwensis]
MSLTIVSWIYLYAAILLEVTGTYFIKLSEGFSRPLPSLCVLLFYGISFWLMSLAVRKIDLGIAYAIWSGIGITAITIIGTVIFKEPITIKKIISIGIIMIGVISLNLDPMSS